MDDTTILGGTLGQLGQAVKKTGQQIVKLPEEMAADLGGQIRGAPLRQGFEGQAKPAGNETQKSKWQSDEERIKFLKDLYGSSKPSSEASASTNASADKSAVKPEEQKKLMELRGQLHRENYYDPLVNPVKKQEERPAEKVEQEKKEEMQDLQQKEAQKPPPLAVVRERNKTEMFRGAAG